MASPPPPYANVTGISRAVMKDSPQETFANYDGNARPGELVVNLDVNPPTLYIGNSLGNLNQVTGNGGGNASLPLSNGNSQFDIAAANGNVTITANGSYTWNFAETGIIILPDGAIIDTSSDNFEVRAVENVNFEANAVFNIYTDTSNNAYQWQFGDDGKITLADGNSIIQSIANSSLDPMNPNVSTMVLTPDQNYSSQALVLDPTAPGHIHLRAPGANVDEPYANLFIGGESSSFEVGAFYGVAPNVYIHSGGNTWTFATDGNLNFPRDASSNSDPYLSIFGGSTPTIQSIDVSLAGPANLAISADYLNYFGYNGNKIVLHADTGEIATDANMVLTTNGANVGNTYSWTFGDDGTLTVPGDLIANGASPAPSLSGFSSITSLVSITTPQPLASLTATAGGRAFASDANLVAAGNFGANVSNGGSNTVPVWSDGTNWYIG